MIAYLSLSDELFRLLNMVRHPVSTALLNNEPANYPFNYLDIVKTDKGFLLSGFPTDKLDDKATFDILWKSTLRREQRPIALINKLLPDRFSNTSLTEWMTAVLHALHPPPTEYKIVAGSKLVDSYLEDNYYIINNGSSTLHKSCMRYDKSQELIQFYAENPERIKSVVGYRNNRVVSRALLWTADEQEMYEPTGRQYIVLDRTYAIDDVEDSAIKDWSKDHCDFIRLHHHHVWREVSTNERKYLHLNVPVHKPTSGLYPYLDTFRYLYEKGHILSNIHPSGLAKAYVFIGTEGRAHNTVQKLSDLPKDFLALETGGVIPKKYCVLHDRAYRAGRHIVCCDMCAKERSIDNLRFVNDKVYCLTHNVVPISDTEYHCYRHNQKLTKPTCDYCEGTKRACGYCGSLDGVQVRPGIYRCVNCTDRGFRTCGNCRGEMDSADAYYSEYLEEHFCEDCFYERHTTCVDCDCTYLNEDLIEHETYLYCDDCIGNHVPSCIQCGLHLVGEANRVHVTFGPPVNDTYTYCRVCHGRFVGTCETCHEPTRLNNNGVTIHHTCRV